jgi:hypothetical protein
MGLRSRRKPLGERVELPIVLLTLALALSVGRSVTAVQAASVPVGYHAGWNLVGGPDGTTFNAAGNAYTFGVTDSSYVTSAGTAPIGGGNGYWMYFPADTTVLMNGTGASTMQVSVPPGTYIMIGNPSGTQSVTVSGADQVLTYDAGAQQYTATTTLGIGQGAWAFSTAGGTITLTATGPATAPPAATAPNHISGAVRIDGQPAPDGTQVVARVGATQCGGALVHGGVYAIDVLGATQSAGCPTDGDSVRFQVTPPFGSGWMLPDAVPFTSGAKTPKDLAVNLKAIKANPDNVPSANVSLAYTGNVTIAICDSLTPNEAAAARSAIAMWQDAQVNMGLNTSLKVDEHSACSTNQPGIAIFWDNFSDPRVIAATTYLDQNLKPCPLSSSCLAFKAVIVLNRRTFARVDTPAEGPTAIAHEIGHALGLAHAKACDGGTIMWSSDACQFPNNHIGVDDVASLNSRAGPTGGTAALVVAVPTATSRTGDVTLEQLRPLIHVELALQMAGGH